MQVVDWPTWLDRHIPYYERDRQERRYLDNPPASVLIVDPVYKNRRLSQRGFAWSTWEAVDTDIHDLGFKAEPIFLDNDTHQRWYWAFWNANEALMAVIRLS